VPRSRSGCGGDTAHDGNRLDFLRVVELGSVGFSHFGPANRKLFEFLKPNDWLAAKPK